MGDGLCAQSLRDIVIGIGDRMDGFMMRSGFYSSQFRGYGNSSGLYQFKDLRERMSKIVVAYDKQGNTVTTKDLEVDGAMTAWMVKQPTQPAADVGRSAVMVHAGPFANIAVGQSSIVADQVALKLSDYHVTESGFGATSVLKNSEYQVPSQRPVPNCAVIVATVRALKMHGGGPKVAPAKPDVAYTEENTGLVEKGCANLVAHIETVKKAGINPVVCINNFYTDTKAEINIVRK